MDEINHATILVIDNEEEFGMSFSLLLGYYGIEVFRAHSPQEALSFIKKKGGGYDLIIVDHDMPGMNWKNAAVALAKENKNKNIVLMLDNYYLAMREQARNYGYIDTIIKEGSVGEIIMAIKSILKRPVKIL